MMSPRFDFDICSKSRCEKDNIGGNILFNEESGEAKHPSLF